MDMLKMLRFVLYLDIKRRIPPQRAICPRDSSLCISILEVPFVAFMELFSAIGVMRNKRPCVTLNLATSVSRA
jgi:hypothetical protein